jgi:hypothetical protein
MVGLKMSQYGLRVNAPVRSILPWQLFIFGSEALRKSFCAKKKFSESSSLDQVLRDLARILMTEIAKVKEKAPAAGESGNQRPKRRKGKLIRLNDLIPNQDVTGGHRLLFGVTDKTQSTNNPTKDK